MEKNMKIKLGALIGSSIITISSLFSLTTLYLKESKQQPPQKPYYQIIKDSQSLNIDMEVANNHGKAYGFNTFIPLQMDETKPVIINCEKDMEKREKEIIQKVIDYYNKLFSTINENYKFEMRDKVKNKDDSTIIFIKNRVIEFDNGNIADGITSIAKGSFNTLDGNFIQHANIDINWEKIKSCDDNLIYSVFLHEFTHVIGLGDVYWHDENCISDSADLKTYMNPYGLNVRAIYPNDYAIFQALYSNEYAKHEDYQDAIEIIQQKIDRYTQLFYQTYSNVLKEEYNATDSLKDKKITTIIWDKLRSTGDSRCFKLEILENNRCEFIISDEGGNEMYRSKGDILFIDGVLFVKNLYVENANLYDESFASRLDLKLMLSFYIDNEGSLVVNDGINLNYFFIKPPTQTKKTLN